MAIFNITKAILFGGPNEPYDPYRRDRGYGRAVTPILDWLEENVGEHYGPGDENVSHIGAGWEIFRLYNGKPESPGWQDTEVSWHVDITDEAKSMLFALKWIK
jgi:hypothetical protein